MFSIGVVLALNLGAYILGAVVECRRRSNRCRHDRVRGVYGDEIIMSGWMRSRCMDCGRWWPTLAERTTTHDGGGG